LQVLAIAIGSKKSITSLSAPRGRGLIAKPQAPPAAVRRTGLIRRGRITVACGFAVTGSQHRARTAAGAAIQGNNILPKASRSARSRSTEPSAAMPQVVVDYSANHVTLASQGPSRPRA